MTMRLLFAFVPVMLVVAPLSSVAADTIFVQFINKFSGGNKPTIIGETNLPNGTNISLILKKPYLPDARSRLQHGLPACEDNCFPLTADTQTIVMDGHFSDGPFTNDGKALPPGAYTLEIITPIFQPPEVEKIIGQHGENLRGPFIYVLEENGQYYPANPPWNPNRSEAERLMGFSLYIRQRLNIP